MNSCDDLASVLCGSDERYAAIAGRLRTSRYFRCVDAILTRIRSPFLTAEYGARFRNCAIDGNWFLQSLTSNAVKEAEGARDLWAMHIALKRHNPTDVAELPLLLRRHAEDEARHVHYYFGFSSLCFFEVLSPVAIKQLLDQSAPNFSTVAEYASPRISTATGVLELMLQINLGEIRTRVHQRLMQPCLLMLCPLEKRHSLSSLIDRLAADELSHVAYTTAVLDKLTEHMADDTLQKTCTQWATHFSHYTSTELGSQGLH